MLAYVFALLLKGTPFSSRLPAADAGPFRDPAGPGVAFAEPDWAAKVGY